MDLIWVALDSASGKEIWRGTANGRAVYSQIGFYRGDEYFVVTDMSGYRHFADKRIKDHLLICSGNSVLWKGDIPTGSRIEIKGSRILAVKRRNGRTLRTLVAVPDKFGAPMGKVSVTAGQD